MKRILLLACALAMVACAQQKASPVLTIEGGQVQGVAADIPGVTVFRGIPYWIGLIVIPSVLLFADRKALAAVDYPLLFTFVFFFIFAGNMARIPAVSRLFSGLLEKNTLLVSVLSCQVISNVPSAILLSQFTSDYPALLVGVNIGGTGTLIASLAALITFREYSYHNPDKKLYYLGVFSALNFGFLIVLTVFMLLIGT